MKATFRLEPILKLRRSIEEQRQIELSVLQSRLAEEINKMEDIIKMQRNIQNHLGLNGESETSLLYLEMLSEQMLFQKKLIRELSTKVAEARERLIEASKSRKMLEKFKERKLKKYKEHLRRQETKFLDEMASLYRTKMTNPLL